MARTRASWRKEFEAAKECLFTPLVDRIHKIFAPNFHAGLFCEGSFKNDVMSGSGAISYPNGYKWEGKFSNGVPDGKGTVFITTNSTTKKSFQGYVKDRELALFIGKDDLKTPTPPDVPQFELDEWQ